MRVNYIKNRGVFMNQNVNILAIGLLSTIAIIYTEVKILGAHTNRPLSELTIKALKNYHGAQQYFAEAFN